MFTKPIILFVCEHGAAKSIVAATYFNELAAKNGLDLKAIARGTNPDQAISEQTAQGLEKDGLIAIEPTPQRLSTNDLQSAQRIVSFCELPDEYGEVGVIEQWNDVSPVSQDYDKARDEILKHLHDLLNRIRSSP
jgi:protein-tyrosine-phosphatase